MLTSKLFYKLNVRQTLDKLPFNDIYDTINNVEELLEVLLRTFTAHPRALEGLAP